MASTIKNTFVVWHALFLREALDRFFGGRAAWAWLAIEPASHLVMMGLIFSVLKKLLPGNVDIFMWICIGMLGFFLFRRTAVQTLHAVDCNKVFFAFRQVRPFDAALARGSVEAFSIFFVGIALIIPMAFFGKQVIPNDPLRLLLAMSGLWFLGLGYGMITSVIQRLVQESGHIFQLIMMPLYIMSGVIMPLVFIPQPYRDWLMLNPVAHGLELCRDAFFEHYIMIPGASFSYLFLWGMIFFFIGLILYKLFETRLVMR